MSLACATEWDYDDYPVDENTIWYEIDWEIKPYDKLRGKRCCSCATMVRNGDDCLYILRTRYARDEVEIRIYGYEHDAVPMATWVYCDKCANQANSLNALGFVWTMDDCIQDLIKDYKVQYQGKDDPCGVKS